MTGPSTGRLVFKIYAKRIGALLGLVLIVVFGGRAVWAKYDPTWDGKKAESKMRHLATHMSSLSLKPVSEGIEPYIAERIPFLVRYNPKYASTNGASSVVYELPNSSIYFLFESPKGNLSVYIHFHSGRAASFSVLHPTALEEEARILAEDIMGAFPGLPVYVEESSHPELKIQTSMVI
jgi:hypothetical protein